LLRIDQFVEQRLSPGCDRYGHSGSLFFVGVAKKTDYCLLSEFRIKRECRRATGLHGDVSLANITQFLLTDLKGERENG
jgi:hypothetical protein